MTIIILHTTETPCVQIIHNVPEDTDPQIYLFHDMELSPNDVHWHTSNDKTVHILSSEHYVKETEE